ncbi:family 16 glycoside hydrolase [Haloferula sp.]|uniref:family 16 glycoside hydrolase n=1 Tax=Haloferula sp. TaxID=2497595 RepID=UPI003C70F627
MLTKSSIVLTLITSLFLATHLRSEEWITLFDGTNLDAWQANENWVVEDGSLRCLPEKLDLHTKEKFKNFELVFEFMVSEGGNSGVKYRFKNDLGAEYQIWDDGHAEETPLHQVAALYDIKEATNKLPSDDKSRRAFHKGRIVASDGYLQHWLDGVKVMEIDMDSEEWSERFGKSKYREHPSFAREAGTIMLQDHGDPVWFRNIKIRSLDFEVGKALYNGPGGCFACHQSDGKGISGAVPPLVNSPWVSDNSDRLITLVLNGLEGPIMVNGEVYSAYMPPLTLFDDEQIAAVINYVRNSYGNVGSVIKAEDVAKIRQLGQQDSSAVKLMREFPFPESLDKTNGLAEDKIRDAPPYSDRPTIVRTFMPGASPAAFAVALVGGQNFCWDAGECRLRYVWREGGFIADRSLHWSSNGKPDVKLMGKPYYRTRHSLITREQVEDPNTHNHKKPVYDTTQAIDFPIRIGSASAGLPQFLGYRLVNKHPEFHYRSSGCDIHELITSNAEGSGIVRTFRIDSKGEPVRVTLDPQDSVRIMTTTGTLAEGVLELTADEAKSFSITIEEIDP